MRALSTWTAIPLLVTAGCSGPTVVDEHLAESHASQLHFYENELRTIATARETKLREYESTVRRQQNQFEQLVGENRSAKAKITDEQTALGAQRAELAKVAAARGALDQEVAKGKAELAALAQQRDTLAKASAAHKAEIVQLERDAGGLGTTLAARRAELGKLKTQSAELDEELATVRGQLAALAGQRGAMQTEVAQLKAMQVEQARLKEQALADLTRQRAEHAAQLGEVARLEAEGRQAGERANSLRQALLGGQAELGKLEERNELLRERTKASRAKKDALEVELARIGTEERDAQLALKRAGEKSEEAQKALARAKELQERVRDIGQQVAKLETELLTLGASQTVLTHTRDAIRNAVVARLRQPGKDGAEPRRPAEPAQKGSPAAQPTPAPRPASKPQG